MRHNTLPLLASAAAAAAGALAISACGSSNASDSASATKTVVVMTAASSASTAPATVTQTSQATQATSATTQASAGAPACATSQLAGSIGPGAGAGMSQNRVSLVLRNTSSTTCTLEGYPGVSWATSQTGGEVGPGATRYNIATPTLVTLAAGAVASAPLDIVDPGVFSPSQCHPLPVTGLRVYPPNQTAYLFVPESLPSPGACQVKTPSPALSVGFMHPGAEAGTDNQ